MVINKSLRFFRLIFACLFFCFVLFLLVSFFHLLSATSKYQLELQQNASQITKHNLVVNELSHNKRPKETQTAFDTHNLVEILRLSVFEIFAAFCVPCVTTGTQKAAKISNKDSFFNWVHSLHKELMNASLFTNLFTNSCDHISTNGKAPLHSHINHNNPQFLYSL